MIPRISIDANRLASSVLNGALVDINAVASVSADLHRFGTRTTRPVDSVFALMAALMISAEIIDAVSSVGGKNEPVCARAVERAVRVVANSSAAAVVLGALVFLADSAVGFVRTRTAANTLEQLVGYYRSVSRQKGES